MHLLLLFCTFLHLYKYDSLTDNFYFYYSNIAEALVQNGLATVVRYRQDEENRSSCYDALLIAEQKAIDSQTGLHSKVEAPKHRVTDCSGVCIKQISINKFAFILFKYIFIEFHLPQIILKICD